MFQTKRQKSAAGTQLTGTCFYTEGMDEKSPEALKTVAKSSWSDFIRTSRFNLTATSLCDWSAVWSLILHTQLFDVNTQVQHHDCPKEKLSEIYLNDSCVLHLQGAMRHQRRTPGSSKQVTTLWPPDVVGQHVVWATSFQAQPSFQGVEARLVIGCVAWLTFMQETKTFDTLSELMFDFVLTITRTTPSLPCVKSKLDFGFCGI